MRVMPCTRLAAVSGATWFIGLASTPAAAHGVHDNSTYLESGMVHAIVTPSTLLGVVALGMLVGLFYTGVATTDERSGARLAYWISAACFGGMLAGLLVPEAQGLAIYAVLPSLGFVGAGALFAAIGFRRAPLALPAAVLVGAVIAISGFLDGPASRDWGWFFGGIVLSVAITVAAVAALTGWLAGRGWTGWTPIAGKIAASWCAAIAVLLVGVLAMPAT